MSSRRLDSCTLNSEKYGLVGGAVYGRVKLSGPERCQPPPGADARRIGGSPEPLWIGDRLWRCVGGGVCQILTLGLCHMTADQIVLDS